MAQNKELLKELKSGQLKIRLNGKKLKGEFALVQTKGRGDNSWLLIKHKDKYASETPVIEKDKSVISKKTLEQIAKSPKSATWESNKKTSKKETAAAPVKTTARRAFLSSAVNSAMSGATRRLIPWAGTASRRRNPPSPNRL